jgi:hypothetical protein
MVTGGKLLVAGVSDIHTRGCKEVGRWKLEWSTPSRFI